MSNHKQRHPSPKDLLQPYMKSNNLKPYQNFQLKGFHVCLTYLLTRVLYLYTSFDSLSKMSPPSPPTLLIPPIFDL